MNLGSDWSCWIFRAVTGCDCDELRVGDCYNAPGCVFCIVARKSSSVSDRSIIYCSRLDDDSHTLGSEPSVAEYGEHLIPAWQALFFCYCYFIYLLTELS